MRKYFFFLPFILVACVNNGDDGSTDNESALPAATHVPEITGFVFSPDTTMYMVGDGTIVVTAEISVRDTGLDIQALWVRMPDGTSVEYAESLATETGTFTKDIPMPTNQIGAFSVEFWLVDAAGDSSDPVTGQFHVVADIQVSDWTNRVSGLPYVLLDVIWDGRVFVAVGRSGTILTSADGIDWVARESGTDKYLSAIAVHGSDIFAVGEDTVLLSTDHGETWIKRTEPDAVNPYAVAVNSSQVVIGGRNDSLDPIIMISEDRGITWQVVEPWSDRVAYVTDLVYRDGLFVAAADTLFFGRIDGGWVVVSSDGALWDDTFRDPESGFLAIVDDGSRFTVAGSDGAVVTSFDGLNWTRLQTPVAGVDYHSAAWNGSKLLIAGGYPCYLHNCNPPNPPLPHGIASSDGGATWDTFDIDGHYLSAGMAWGNGRFVSVGWSLVTEEGAIYTTE